MLGAIERPPRQFVARGATGVIPVPLRQDDRATTWRDRAVAAPVLGACAQSVVPGPRNWPGPGPRKTAIRAQAHRSGHQPLRSKRPGVHRDRAAPLAHFRPRHHARLHPACRFVSLQAGKSRPATVVYFSNPRTVVAASRDRDSPSARHPPMTLWRRHDVLAVHRPLVALRKAAGVRRTGNPGRFPITQPARRDPDLALPPPPGPCRRLAVMWFWHLVAQ